MAGTLKTPAPTDPIKANGFYSFVVTIPDDDVFSFTPKGSWGFIYVATSSVSGYGQFWYRGSAAVKVNGAAATVAGSGVLTGTTGTDGNLTVSSTDNVLYIENRLGASQTCTVTLMTHNSAYE